jgi:hypothetical protein
MFLWGVVVIWTELPSPALSESNKENHNSEQSASELMRITYPFDY